MHRLASICVLLLLSSAAFAADTIDSSGNALLSTCKVAVNVDSLQFAEYLGRLSRTELVARKSFDLNWSGRANRLG
jgi:type 1 fimbria pilin